MAPSLFMKCCGKKKKFDIEYLDGAGSSYPAHSVTIFKSGY